MILVRSPLRITLGGGGTDLPAYSRQHGGVCLSAAIDKYVYVGITRPFYPGIYLKYSESEKCETVSEIQHPIIREVLTHVFPDQRRRIEITTLADVPAGTGLGSSSSFTTALVCALATYQKFGMMSADLAKTACDIEINRLGHPIGTQDQFSAAYGGVNLLEFNEDDTVSVTPLPHPPELQDYLLLFFTGATRDTPTVLSKQADMTENLHAVKALGQMSAACLSKGDLSGFASAMNQQWDLKEARCPSSFDIVACREYALLNGALGAKLVGAGGGGFLLFYTEEPKRLRAAMAQAGLDELRFRFDYEGAKVLLS